MGAKGVWNFPAIGNGSVSSAACSNNARSGTTKGPYSVKIEFEGEPWPPLEQCQEAVNRSYATEGLGSMVALGMSRAVVP